MSKIFRTTDNNTTIAVDHITHTTRSSKGLTVYMVGGENIFITVLDDILALLAELNPQPLPPGAVKKQVPAASVTISKE